MKSPFCVRRKIHFIEVLQRSVVRIPLKTLKEINRFLSFDNLTKNVGVPTNYVSLATPSFWTHCICVTTLMRVHGFQAQKARHFV
ncbi:hypothetical protein LEP1GSC187_3302 [Leptospira santarosai str. ZUN179]|uniref:Uncharacterized protein n=1 Tax=Leptospira santarosai str. ZUN179 TaxID=1049985 RepID=M6V857_9LEPT|nr:hypothetical protein LEP1GSC187_3302 [Leptospira santarosai str. ZUN179]